MRRVPFLLLGDGPAEPTGLGRIARDLASQLLATDLPLDLVQVGGSLPPVWTAWRHVPLDRAGDWGAQNVGEIYNSIWGRTPGILFAVWDPSRLLDYLAVDLPVQRWAYCAIDGANIQGAIGGPAGDVLRQLDRVLAYGPYGAGIIKETIGGPVSWLPHGVSLETYAPVNEAERAWAAEQLGPYAIGKVVVGCVMTNQPRKDLGVLCHAIRLLRESGVNAYLWLHTDEMIKAWSVQQLVEDFGLARLVTVTGVNGAHPYSDRQLACMYQACAITLLPSLGEGFGYPIVESLASGVPCVHTDWAGGRDLVPLTAWRVPVRTTRVEGVYALQRPVTLAQDWCNAARRALEWRQAEGVAGEAYLRGSVAHLDWRALWGRWQAWFRRGLA